MSRLPLLFALALAACESTPVEPDPVAYCGDGNVDAGEACDDGNADNSDDCTALCTVAECGDGFVQAGVEACDHGADNADDASCRADCSVQTCGDGTVGPGEACDDGDANADDGACRTDCTPETCGDGVAGPTESCDDGNSDDTDDCLSTCEHASCGDGIVGPLEDCDDGNDAAGDGCTDCSVDDGFVCDGGGCDCDEGYTGADCATCDFGYQDEDGDGVCVVDCSRFDGCDSETEVCTIDEGEPTCECAPGLYDLDGTCGELEACIVHVAVDGSGDGASWATATANLQGAIATAAGLAAERQDSACEVWVGEGVWSFSAEAPLALAPNVTVRGGFSGVETEADARDFAGAQPRVESVLTLSGVTGTVVQGASDATLEGVVIAGGRLTGDRASHNSWGAGLRAVDVEGLRIAHSTFRDNHAAGGGAAYIEGGSVIFDGVHFEDNVVSHDGGAIAGHEATQITLTNSTFEANSTTNGHGGAVSMVNVDTFEVDASAFAYNISRWDGGAIFLLGTRFSTVTDTSFRVNNSVDDPGCLGGGIAARAANQEDVDDGLAGSIAGIDTLFVEGSAFASNHARFEGAGMYVLGAEAVDVWDTTFTAGFTGDPEDAFDGGRGSAIAIYETAALSLIDDRFDGNVTMGDGGALYVSEVDDISIERSGFRANVATTVHGGAGSLYDVGSVAIRDATFDGNHAQAYGGALYIHRLDSLQVDDTAFRANSADGVAAALLVQDDDRTSDINLAGLTVEEHVSDVIGVVVTHYTGPVTVSDSLFVDNAVDAGSVLKAWQTGPVLIQRVEALFNSHGWGSAVTAHNVPGVTIEDSTFEGNLSTALGAVLYICDDTVDRGGFCTSQAGLTGDDYSRDPIEAQTVDVVIRGTDLLDNVGTSGAPVVRAAEVDSFTLTDVRLDGNVVETVAPVFVTHAGDAVVADAEFAGNIGSRADGVYMQNLASFTASGSAFTELDLPGLWVEYTDTVEVGSSSFEGQGADGEDLTSVGSCAFLSNTESVSVTDSSFTDCESSNAGGLWVNNGVSATLTDLSFTNNWAEFGGAFVVGVDGDVTLTNVNSSGNNQAAELSGFSVGGGGAISRASTVTVSDSTFDNNRTTDAGSGLYIWGGLSEVLVEGSTFTNNVSDSVDVGGGLYIDSTSARALGEATVRDCVFEGNTALKTGAGAALRGFYEITVESSVFRNNTTSDDATGAGLQLTNTEFAAVDACEFYGNTAGDTSTQIGWGGAGLALHDLPYAVVANSLFDANIVSNADGSITRGGAVQFRPVNSLLNAAQPGLLIYGSTFTGNQATTAHVATVNAYQVQNDAAIDLDVVDTLAWGQPASGDLIGYYNVTWQDHPAGFTTTTSLLEEADPLFTNNSSDPYGAYRPGAASPAVGAGTGSVDYTTDLQASPRATPPTIGALEAASAP